MEDFTPEKALELLNKNGDMLKSQENYKKVEEVVKSFIEVFMNAIETSETRAELISVYDKNYKETVFLLYFKLSKTIYNQFPYIAEEYKDLIQERFKSLLETNGFFYAYLGYDVIKRDNRDGYEEEFIDMGCDVYILIPSYEQYCDILISNPRAKVDNWQKQDSYDKYFEEYYARYRAAHPKQVFNYGNTIN